MPTAGVGLSQGPLMFMVTFANAVLVELVLLSEVVETAFRHEARGPLFLDE